MNSIYPLERPSRCRLVRLVVVAFIVGMLLASLGVSTAEAQNRRRRGASRKKVVPLPPFDARNHVPPIIIDDGSLEISSVARFRMIDTEVLPRPYQYRQIEPAVYGTIRAVRIIDDYGNVLLDSLPVAANQTATIKIWLQKVDNDSSDDEVTFYPPDPPYSDSRPPQVIITGGTLDIRTSETLDSPEKKRKRRSSNHKGNKLKKLDGKYFRVAQVSVNVGATTFTTEPTQADSGIRVIIAFRH